MANGATLEILERPDVRVFQEFGPESPTVIRPLLEGCIVGQCFQIEEKALAGAYFGALASYLYPNKKVGAIVQLSEVEVFLQQGSDEYDVTSQLVLAGGTITATDVDFPAAFAPQKDIVAQRQVSPVAGTVLEDPNTDFITLGVKPGDILQFVTVALDLIKPDSVVSAQAGNYTVLNVLSENSIEVSPVLIDETKVEYKIIRQGTQSGDVLISYRALRVDLVGQLIEMQNSDEREQLLGPADALKNPLSFGVMLAQLHTDGIVAAVAIEADTLAEFTEAAEFLESKEVYGIVPLTFRQDVHQMFQKHVVSMSAPSAKRERCVFVTQEILDKVVYQAQSLTGSTLIGSDTFTDAGALFLTNGVPIGAILKFAVPQGFGGSPVTEIVIKAILSETTVQVVATADATVAAIDYTVETRPFTKLQQALNIQALSKSIKERRVINSVPDIAEILADSSEIDIPGYFVNCCTTGLISGSNPAQGFTNFPLAGITGLKHSNFYFSETQLGVIAAGGTYIYMQETVQTPIISRHQLTTDVQSIERRELSIMKAVDYMAKYLRSRIRALIGINNITDNFLNNILRPQVNSIIEDVVEDRIMGRGTRITRVVQDETQPDTVKVDITLDVLFPANYIDFTLII